MIGHKTTYLSALKLCWLAVMLINPMRAGAHESFAPLAEAVIPSVVNISTQVAENEDAPNVKNRLLFETSDGRIALGSGFVVEKKGLIATNRHVIEKASRISVVTSNGNVYEATLAGVDPETDLALVKIEPEEDLQEVRFGNSDDVRVGDWVLAVGNPFGLGSSVTVGIVSAKARDIGSGLSGDYLQTDASINQGNSGGPMFNTNGDLVGVNTAIFSNTEYSVGVGFALPSNEALWVIRQLQKHGKVERSSLGIKLKETTLADGQKGLIITEITDEDLAVQNNLQPGYVILSLNGKKLHSAKAFLSEISKLKPQTEVTLGLLVSEAKVEQKVKTVILEADRIKQTETKKTPENSHTDMAELKASTQTVLNHPRSYPELGLELEDYKVVFVVKDSEADAKGIQTGDEIVRINQNPLSTPEDVSAYIAEALAADKILHIDLKDANGDRYFVELKPQAKE